MYGEQRRTVWMVVLHCMNNGAINGNNKGYIFANLFDICLYSILSLILPVLSFWVEIIKTPIIGLQTIYSLSFSAFFMTATFFYDFYSRYRDCENQTKFVVYALCFGRTLFFVATLIVFVLMYFVSKDMYVDAVKKGLFVILTLCLYPFVLSINEAYKRVRAERARKISIK